jgi:hypothetical protein
VKQAAICHAVSADFATRGKKTKLMRLGFAGFCCRHCKQNYPNSTGMVARGKTAAPIFQASCRSFSSSSDNLASAMSNSFVMHLLKCPYTPRNIQQSLQTLKRLHPRQMQQLPYGSQSRLFAELWRRIRSADKSPGITAESSQSPEEEQEDGDEEYVPDSPLDKSGEHDVLQVAAPARVISSTVSPVLDSSPVPSRGPTFPVADQEETQQVLKEAEDNWDPTENDNLILPEDRNLVSDYVFLCMRQLKVALPTSADFRGNRRNNVLSRMAGMCCIHCCEIPGQQYVMPSGRTFPSAPDNMASALNVSTYSAVTRW